MNYHGLAIPLKGFLVDRHIRPSKFAEMFESRFHALPREVALAMMNLMDSHDTDRLASMCVNGELIQYQDQNHIAYAYHASTRRNPGYEIRAPNARERAIQRMVAVFQTAAAGAPMIYYGTEAGMWGGGDPDCRMPMVWPGIEYEPQSRDPRGRERKPDVVAFDQALHDFYQSCFALRRALPVLRRGDQRVVLADDDRWLFGLARFGHGRAVVAVFNRNDEPRSFTVELPPEVATGLGQQPRILLETGHGEGAASCRLEGGKLDVSLPALGAAILGPG
ncbi:MAG: hypothetical protein N2322_04700 [Terrimicrobiaceae bacterium]|nr:hypothetical protein [Terrimicrobiaceae bacterium]